MKRLIQIMLFTLCLLPGTVNAASGPPSTRPSADQIRWEATDVYEYTTVVYGGVPRASIKGKYLGVGLKIYLDCPEPDYHGFIAVAQKTKATPARLRNGFSQNRAYVGEAFTTNALDPESTYYIYVATFNSIGYSGFEFAYSEWSDPVEVKTPAAKVLSQEETNINTDDTTASNNSTSDTSTSNTSPKESNTAITKKTNAITVEAKKVNVSYKKLKRAKVTVKPFTVKNAVGKVTYKKVSGSNKITVSRTGKITIKKKTKRGTNKIVVAVTASGDSEYKAVTKNVTVSIRIK